MHDFEPSTVIDKLNTKAYKWAQVVGHLPKVVAVFLSGSIAQGRGDQNSDIDFFIVTQPGGIWTARFFTNLILKLTFNLSKPAHHRACICPNHFITADSLEIMEQDAYSAHLFSHNQPLYDPYNLWEDFVEANSWVEAFSESFPVLVKTAQHRKKKSPQYALKKGGLIESILRWLQLKKIYRNPDFKKPGAKIVLKSTELRFHPDPKNQYWENKKVVDLGKKERQADVEIMV